MNILSKNDVYDTRVIKQYFDTSINRLIDEPYDYWMEKEVPNASINLFINQIIYVNDYPSISIKKNEIEIDPVITFYYLKDSMSNTWEPLPNLDKILITNQEWTSSNNVKIINNWKVPNSLIPSEKENFNTTIKIVATSSITRQEIQSTFDVLVDKKYLNSASMDYELIPYQNKNVTISWKSNSINKFSINLFVSKSDFLKSKENLKYPNGKYELKQGYGEIYRFKGENSDFLKQYSFKNEFFPIFYSLDSTIDYNGYYRYKYPIDTDIKENFYNWNLNNILFEIENVKIQISGSNLNTFTNESFINNPYFYFSSSSNIIGMKSNDYVNNIDYFYMVSKFNIKYMNILIYNIAKEILNIPLDKVIISKNGWDFKKISDFFLKKFDEGSCFGNQESDNLNIDTAKYLLDNFCIPIINPNNFRYLQDINYNNKINKLLKSINELKYKIKNVINNKNNLNNEKRYIEYILPKTLDKYVSGSYFYSATEKYIYRQDLNLGQITTVFTASNNSKIKYISENWHMINILVDDTIYSSKNRGESWSKYTFVSSSQIPQLKNITCIGLDDYNNIYAGTYNGKIYCLYTDEISNNAVIPLSLSNPYDVGNNNPIIDIIRKPTDDKTSNIMYISTLNGSVYSGSAQNLNFKPLSYNNATQKAYKMSINNFGDKLFTYTNKGLYKKDLKLDNVNSVTNLNNPFHPYHIKCMDIYENTIIIGKSNRLSYNGYVENMQNVSWNSATINFDWTDFILNVQSELLPNQRIFETRLLISKTNNVNNLEYINADVYYKIFSGLKTNDEVLLSIFENKNVNTYYWQVLCTIQIDGVQIFEYPFKKSNIRMGQVGILNSNLSIINNEPNDPNQQENGETPSPIPIGGGNNTGTSGTAGTSGTTGTSGTAGITIITQSIYYSNDEGNNWNSIPLPENINYNIDINYLYILNHKAGDTKDKIIFLVEFDGYGIYKYDDTKTNLKWNKLFSNTNKFNSITVKNKYENSIFIPQLNHLNYKDFILYGYDILYKIISSPYNIIYDNSEIYNYVSQSTNNLINNPSLSNDIVYENNLKLIINDVAPYSIVSSSYVPEITELTSSSTYLINSSSNDDKSVGIKITSPKLKEILYDINEALKNYYIFPNDVFGGISYDPINKHPVPKQIGSNSFVTQKEMGKTSNDPYTTNFIGDVNPLLPLYIQTEKIDKLSLDVSLQELEKIEMNKAIYINKMKQKYQNHFEYFIFNNSFLKIKWESSKRFKVNIILQKFNSYQDCFNDNLSKENLIIGENIIDSEFIWNLYNYEIDENPVYYVIKIQKSDANDIYIRSNIFIILESISEQILIE